MLDEVEIEALQLLKKALVVGHDDTYVSIISLAEDFSKKTQV